MKKYFIYLFILFLTGCSTTPQKSYTENIEVFVIESQLCLQDTSEKFLPSYSFNEFMAEGWDKDHPQVLLLPYGPLNPTFIGTTANNSLIYTQTIGYSSGLKFTVFNTEHYSFSFKRDFPMYVYTQQWSQWQYADVSEAIDNRYYLNKLKVRFRAMNTQLYHQYVSTYYKQPNIEKLDNCD